MKQETKPKNKKKSLNTNIIFFGIIALLVFTPAGKQVKIWTSKLLAFSPSVKKEENREKLTNYNWQFVDDNGRLFELNSAKGKVLFLNLWATWCPPCIAEMPSIQELYNNYKDNPDVVFVFATTDPKSTVDAFMQKNNYTIPSHYIQSIAPEQLASRSIPTTFLIGRNGEIAIRKVGSANWNGQSVHEAIEGLLKE